MDATNKIASIEPKNLRSRDDERTGCRRRCAYKGVVSIGAGLTMLAALRETKTPSWHLVRESVQA